MVQVSLFEHEPIVNVASVPKRSPFRYPGGKTWLVPRIREWLAFLQPRSPKLIEPFVGGGIVSLTAVAERLVERVTMVELDDQVAAVWRAILEEPDRLAERIVSFTLTRETLDEALSIEPRTNLEKGFQTILKNRTFHGGILAPGSAPIKHGENGKGVTSRWYPETLKKRILAIAELRDRIEFIHGNAFDVIRTNTEEEAVFFIDPPYTAGGKSAGSRLYTHSEIDHRELFQSMNRVRGDFLMTYDNAPEVRELAAMFGFDTELIAMKNTHHAPMKELLIGRNLDWARRWKPFSK